jgi:phosphoglucomutase
MAAYEKSKGKTLFEKLIELYVKFGFYKEGLISITKKGMDGKQQIADMMQGFRNHPPKEINGSKVVRLMDYDEGKGIDFKTGETWKINLPKSNVLQFATEDGSLISARPSGTEPKIKFYFSVKEPLENAAQFDEVNKKLDEKIQAIITSMNLQ